MVQRNRTSICRSEERWDHSGKGPQHFYLKIREMGSQCSRHTGLLSKDQRNLGTIEVQAHRTSI